MLEKWIHICGVFRHKCNVPPTQVHMTRARDHGGRRVEHSEEPKAGEDSTVLNRNTGPLHSRTQHITGRLHKT